MNDPVIEFADLWASWLPRIAESPGDPILGMEIEGAAWRLVQRAVPADQQSDWGQLLGKVALLGMFMVEGNPRAAYGAFLLVQEALKGATAIVVQAALDGR